MKISYPSNPSKAYGFGMETVSVPAGKTADPALKLSYSYALGFRGGTLVNHSTNIFWVMILATTEAHPTRTQVVDFGLRINANGGIFTIPDQSEGLVYLATSATSALECRAMYYVRDK